MATSFSGGGSPSTRREPPILGKQLVNFITCDCRSSAPFFVIYKAGREPTPLYNDDTTGWQQQKTQSDDNSQYDQEVNHVHIWEF